MENSLGFLLNIHPCQLHEYLSDKDTYSTLNDLLNELYYSRVSDRHLAEPFLQGGQFCPFDTK